MFRDVVVVKAINAILQRAEREEPARLLQSYVDPGLLAELENKNNQIVYGRRGTGKTHLFAKLEACLRDLPEPPFVVPVDFRTLGSTKLFTDPTEPLEKRCFGLFQDILSSIINRLSPEVVNLDSASIPAMAALDHLGKVVTEPFVQEVGGERSVEESRKHDDRTSIELSASTKTGFGLKGKLDDGSVVASATKTTSQLVYKDTILYPDVQGAFDDFFKATRRELYLLLDEWSSIPLDVQPYFADFIRRCFLPNRNIVVKIAALEQRSIFSLREAKTIVGIELGAELGPNFTIDDYFVYERNPAGLIDLSARILWHHLNVEIGPYLAEQFRITNASGLIDAMFTNEDTFAELVRSSEGVVRDLINVFTGAARSVYIGRRDRIEIGDVVEAARTWYSRDKISELRHDLRAALSRIAEVVSGCAGARYFFLPIALERHPVIDGLFDGRVLHLISRYYRETADAQHYNIYSIDYGAYIQPRAGETPRAVEGLSTLGGLVRPFGAGGAEIPRVELSARALIPEVVEILEVGELGVGFDEHTL